MKLAHKAFTLAEVLITLGILGVVAAITIPTLVQNYKDRAWATANKVFVRRLEEALKTMNTQQTLAGYRSTADFVGELSKHFKIVKTCQNDDLMSCFEDKVIWGSEEVDMTNVKNASHFGQDEWDTDIIGVQFANGTTGLIAYNPSCTEKPFTNQYSGTDCLAILYDTDGFKNPNTQMKDLNSINVNSLGGNNCAIELSDGTCFGAPFHPEPLNLAECEAEKNNLGIKVCFTDKDYWAGAVKACGGVGKMPTQAQLSRLARDLYQNPNSNFAGNRNDDLAISMGFITNASDRFWVWSRDEHSTETSVGFAYFLDSQSVQAKYYGASRANNAQQAVCVMN